jgi:hypothetical protein
MQLYSFHLKGPMRTELKAPAIELFSKEVVLIQYNPFKNKFNPGALNQSSWGLSGGTGIVAEKPDQTIVGIEIKSSRSLNSDDLKGLRHLQKIAKKKFKRGIILHPGTEIEYLDEDLWALPIQKLWI